MAKKQQYVAAIDITVEGKAYKQGETLVDVPDGCMRSMIRMGQAVKSSLATENAPAK